MYLTLTVDDDAARAAARMDAFLEGYYGAPAAALRRRQAVYSGPAEGVAAWLDGYAKAGATDLCCASPATTNATWRRWREWAGRWAGFSAG